MAGCPRWMPGSSLLVVGEVEDESEPVAAPERTLALAEVAYYSVY